MRFLQLILFELILLSIILFSCSENKIIYSNYGPFKVDSTAVITLDEMLQKFQKNTENSAFTFSAPIVDVCQTAGCWVNVKSENGELIRVRFKDHFLIPTKTKVNRMAYFHGNIYWDTISVEMQKHFAEDAEKTKDEIARIIEPKLEVNFEADGVLIKSHTSKKSKKTD